MSVAQCPGNSWEVVPLVHIYLPNLFLLPLKKSPRTKYLIAKRFLTEQDRTLVSEFSMLAQKRLLILQLLFFLLLVPTFAHHHVHAPIYASAPISDLSCPFFSFADHALHLASDRSAGYQPAKTITGLLLLLLLLSYYFSSSCSWFCTVMEIIQQCLRRQIVEVLWDHGNVVPKIFLYSNTPPPINQEDSFGLLITKQIQNLQAALKKNIKIRPYLNYIKTQYLVSLHLDEFISQSQSIFFISQHQNLHPYPVSQDPP